MAAFLDHLKAEAIPLGLVQPIEPLGWAFRRHEKPESDDPMRATVSAQHTFLYNRLQSALSTSDRTPAAILRPVWACTLKGCRIKPRREPPIRALAPMP
jgi:hypothetical protein